MLSIAHPSLCDEPPWGPHTRFTYAGRVDTTSSFDSNLWPRTRSLWIGYPIPWRSLRCYWSTATCRRNATNDGPSGRNWTPAVAQVRQPLLLFGLGTKLTYNYRFMSTPMGFRYLYSAGYIDREMDMWFHVCNFSCWEPSAECHLSRNVISTMSYRWKYFFLRFSAQRL